MRPSNGDRRKQVLWSERNEGTEEEDAVLAVCYSPDGTTLAAGGQ